MTADLTRPGAPLDLEHQAELDVALVLVRDGIITRQQLDEALSAQRRLGGALSRHLMIDAWVPRRTIYRHLAEEWQAPYLDMLAEPPDATAVTMVHRHHDGVRWFAHHHWLPWRMLTHDGEEALVFATSVAPNERLLAEVRETTGHQHVLARTTTDFDIFRTCQDIGRAQLLYRITDYMADNMPDASARGSVVTWQKVVPIVLLVTLVVGLVFAPHWAILAAYCVANLLFVNNVAFKVLYGLRSPLRRRQVARLDTAIGQERATRGYEPEWPGRMRDEDLPMYTVLVPVYDEVEVVQKVIDNMERMDYPKSKLDVMILLEEKDQKTIEAAKSSRPPEYVRIVVVPEGHPQTKPRACNYGLEFALGEYVVIFDAEDRPNPDQLRKAVAAFRLNRLLREHVDPYEPKLVCVQGALAYFNYDYNLLTRLFSIEYSHWFDMMLPGMDQAGLPLPLGGTSNHFETEVLRNLGAWDPYNVTEDADLGLRIASQGYKIGIIDSATEEEATSESFAWIRQRTRWIKGYMITAAVNTRHPVRWWRLNGVGGAVSMGGLVLGTPLAFLAYPLALLFTVVTYIGIRTGLDFPQWILSAGILMMVFGNGAMIVFAGIAAWRRYGWRIALYAVFNPIYWLMHSVAAWRAAYQLIFDPFTWEKTPHGLTGDYDSTTGEGH
ncbi:glycosyltransferase [Nocardioides sp. Iso805N]|uniref:glycosyltransferase n=1 Tax=Nocardioides sp. Iso805N TaxID=1283287 RepID=UPI00035E665D|nr:glycosyltransferase [Nocardioides sp. Iso805N]